MPSPEDSSSPLTKGPRTDDCCAEPTSFQEGEEAERWRQPLDNTRSKRLVSVPPKVDKESAPLPTSDSTSATSKEEGKKVFFPPSRIRRALPSTAMPAAGSLAWRLAQAVPCQQQGVVSGTSLSSRPGAVHGSKYKFAAAEHHRISLAQSSKRRRAALMAEDQQTNYTYALAAYTASTGAGDVMSSSYHRPTPSHPYSAGLYDHDSASNSFADLFARPSTPFWREACCSTNTTPTSASRLYKWGWLRNGPHRSSNNCCGDLFELSNHDRGDADPSRQDEGDGARGFLTTTTTTTSSNLSNQRRFVVRNSMLGSAHGRGENEMRTSLQGGYDGGTLQHWIAENSDYLVRDAGLFSSAATGASNLPSQWQSSSEQQSPRLSHPIYPPTTGEGGAWHTSFSSSDQPAAINGSWSKQGEVEAPTLASHGFAGSSSSCVHRDRHAASMASSDRTSTSTGRSEDRVSTGLWSSSRRSSSADTCVGEENPHVPPDAFSAPPCSNGQSTTDIATPSISPLCNTHKSSPGAAAPTSSSSSVARRAKYAAFAPQKPRRDALTTMHYTSDAKGGDEGGKSRENSNVMSASTSTSVGDPNHSLPPQRDATSRPSGATAQQRRHAVSSVAQRPSSRTGHSHHYDSCHRVCRCLAFHFVKGCRNLPPEMACHADDSFLESVFGPCPYSAAAAADGSTMGMAMSAPAIVDSVYNPAQGGGDGPTNGNDPTCHLAHEAAAAAADQRHSSRLPKSIEIGGTTFFFPLHPSNVAPSSKPPSPKSTPPVQGNIEQTIGRAVPSPPNAAPTGASPTSSPSSCLPETARRQGTLQNMSPLPYNRRTTFSSMEQQMTSSQASLGVSELTKVTAPQKQAIDVVAPPQPSCRKVSSLEVSSFIELPEEHAQHREPNSSPPLPSTTELPSPICTPDSSPTAPVPSSLSSTTTTTTVLRRLENASVAEGPSEHFEDDQHHQLTPVTDDGKDKIQNLSESEAAVIWNFLCAFVRRRRHECMKEDQFRFIINETKQRMALRDLPMVLRGIGDGHWSNALAPDCWLAPRVSSKSPLGQIARSFSFRFLFPLSLVFPETDDVPFRRKKPNTTPLH